jgi:hypothetical protein
MKKIEKEEIEKEEIEKEEIEKEEIEKEEIEKEEIEKEETKKLNDKITIINSIKENYLSWICIFISIFIISPNNYFKGMITFFFILFLSYYSHISSHKYDNIFTILHRYHHNNNNFFSHFIHYTIELGFPGFFLPLYYLFGPLFLDEWIVMFSVLFYSSVHNINYGYFHVNNVHTLHHKHYLTNIGPDICDIIFGTKNPLNESVENTNHYIPNIIIITILILFIKYLYLNETYKNIIKKIITYFLLACLIINTTSSLYFYVYNIS